MALTAQQKQTLFTDPKMNAMREAAIAGDWSRLFSIAPRGCGSSKGVTTADKRSGVCGDTDSVRPGSAQGKALVYFWDGKNPLRKTLTIQDLRYTKNEQGEIVPVPLTRKEIEDYYYNYQWARHDWYCRQRELNAAIESVSGGSLIYPLNQCRETSWSKKKKVIKKVAAVGAAVVGGVFLGPAVAGVAKAGAVKLGAAAGSIGASAGKVVDVINSGRTIKAIKDGKMPPPPIDISGQGFRDWAEKTAIEEFQESQQRKITRAEEEQLRREIAAMQAELQRMTPRNTPMSPDPAVSREAQSIMANEKRQTQTLNNAALIGIPIIAALILRG